MATDTSAVAFLLQATPWTTIDVRRGSVAEVSVRIGADADTVQREGDAEECLAWQFELEEYDIGFQVLEDGKPTRDLVRYHASTSSSRNRSKSKSSNSASTQSSDFSRPSLPDASTVGTPTSTTTAASDADTSSPRSHQMRIEDTLEHLHPNSTYTFRWDNSYSLVRHKRLRYRFLVTSKRAFAAAESAARESIAKRLVEQKKNRWAGSSLRPHVARALARLRALPPAEAAAAQHEAIETLKQCVTDLVASFMMRPDSPLHEGSVRAFVLALETVLRHGAKDAFLDEWPEEPYYEFLLETGSVLRDDEGLVAEVKALEPPETLRYLGWGRARAFLFLALNKKLLHRAFENLTKRRILVERYYEPHAVLFDYARATQIASFLSALNAVTFLLAPLLAEPDDLRRSAPGNLLQCAPDAPLLGHEKLEFSDGINADSAITRGLDGDPNQIKHIQSCSLPRYLLHEQPFTELQIGRGSVVHVPLALKANEPVLVIQLQVLVQDINVSISQDETTDLAKPVLVSASDLWTEGVFRVKTQFKPLLSIKLDNSFSIVRAKQVRLRYRVASGDEYARAWEACVEMAQLMSWKHAVRAGAERCAQFMDSLRLQEEEAIEQQRNREPAEGKKSSEHQQASDESILGIPTSLIANPVSYLVGGILAAEPSSCAQCMAPFSFFSRQHQCSGCQSVVCIPCSRHYVRLNGKGPEVKTCDRCFLKEKDNERKRLGGGSGQTQTQGECAEYAALRRDPAMDKYFKMLGFGVPASGVAQKMMQDNVELEKIDVFSAGPSGPNLSIPSLTRRESTGNSRRLNRRGSSAFRKVHWTSLESKKASESIWTRVTARRKTAPITLSPHDFQELEQLFGDASSGAAQSRNETKAGGGNGPKRFSGLDSRRSNNISIGLSQFKALGGVEAIVRSVKNCDFAFLTPERLASLYDIAPTSVEAKRYTDFRGSRARLEPSERFLVEMCEIPRVTEKMATMLFIAQFDHQQRELRDRIGAITRACDEVLHSERLARCFELVLAIGNLLNAGTDLEGARGVTLASLLKLSETKSIDRTTTLLQFIIKLIHDRGEGDILLFVNDLASLADAKRFSNLICVSQFRALQSGIAQVETEIKEEMVIDVKRFRIEEQRRREQFEQQRRGGTSVKLASANSRRPPLIRHTANLTHSDPRGALFAAIRQRESSSGDGDVGADASESGESKGARHAMLIEALTKRQQQAVTEPDKRPNGQADASGSRAALLSAIQTRQQSPSSGSDGRAALMDALKNRRPSLSQSHQSGDLEDASQPQGARVASIANRRADQDNAADVATPSSPPAANPRAALLAAISQRGAPQGKALSTPTTDESGGSRSALLAAIRTPRNASESSSARQSSSYASDGASAAAPMNPQAALLATIRNRGATQRGEPAESTSTNREGDGGAGSDAAVQFVPREYTMDNKFITDMRQRLLEIKSVYEDLEMELEAMNAAWEATARYLGEDPSASSSEYIFNLLNRFRLDVKVVKSLLFRKGLSFASDLRALLPNAQVGSVIATTLGPGVVTALRVVDRRIEVKFPWSREAYLSPSCILSAGSLVRCRVLGVGIIRETRFDDGFCCVRFAFGIGIVRVGDIAPETSSNASSLRHAILQTAFCIGDPVLTPFGCGHVQSIQRRQSQPIAAPSTSNSNKKCCAVEAVELTAVASGNGGGRASAHTDGVLTVRLLASDLRSGGREHDEPAAGTAFVHFCHASLNY